MSGAEGESNDVERLKALLFGVEKDRLADTAERLDKLEAWIGDAPRLEAAAAHVLVEAFKRAEIERHRDLALAVAPVVVAAIRAEIVNSRDMMVEALYPIAGRMVAAAVANAFRELIDAINQRIDALTSTDQWRLRLKSLASGRSMAEVALAESRGARCVRAMLIERGGGRLLAQWRPQGASDDNPDLIGGLIAAITEFASTVFADRLGELRNLDLGATRVYLRASSRIILAAEMVGAVTSEQERTIDARFLSLVDRNDRGDSLLDRDLAEVAAPTRRKSAVSRRLRWVVASAIAAVCLGLALRGPVYRWRKTAEIEAALQAAKASDPRLESYPLGVSEDWSANTVDVHGLAPSGDDARKLVEALATVAAPLAVASHVEIVAPAEALETAQARLAQLTEALASEGAAGKALADRLASEEKANAALRAELADKFAALKAEIDQSAEGASSALRAELAALRDQSDKVEDGLRQAQDAARAEDSEIEDLSRNLGILSAHLDAAQGRSETEIGDVGAKIAALAERLSQLQSAIADTARTLDAASAQARDNAKQAAADARSQIEELGARLDAANHSVPEIARQSVVYFVEKDTFADPAAAAAVVDRVAEAIKRTGEGVRVVGYGDEMGPAAANSEVSGDRAQKVAQMLIDRGVPAAKAIAVGRGSQNAVSQHAAAGSRNRRVVFEPLLPGEAP